MHLNVNAVIFCFKLFVYIYIKSFSVIKCLCVYEQFNKLSYFKLPQYFHCLNRPSNSEGFHRPKMRIIRFAGQFLPTLILLGIKHPQHLCPFVRQWGDIPALSPTPVGLIVPCHQLIRFCEFTALLAVLEHDL